MTIVLQSFRYPLHIVQHSIINDLLQYITKLFLYPVEGLEIPAVVLTYNITGCRISGHSFLFHPSYFVAHAGVILSISSPPDFCADFNRLEVLDTCRLSSFLHPSYLSCCFTFINQVTGISNLLPCLVNQSWEGCRL